MMNVGTVFGGVRIPPSIDGVIAAYEGGKPVAWRLTSVITGEKVTVWSTDYGQGRRKPYRLVIEGQRIRAFGWRITAIEAAIEYLLAGHSNRTVGLEE